MNKSTLLTIVGASLLALPKMGSANNLQKIEWTSDDGSNHSINAEHLGSGSFSEVYLDKSTSMVYAVTEERDRAKYILSEIYKTNKNKHLPKIEYLGRHNKNGQLYWVTRMPLYSEITESDPLYQTLSFLRQSSRDWTLKDFESTCLKVQRKYKDSKFKGHKEEFIEKVSALRKSLINHLKSTARNQTQIHSIIETLTIIDEYLDAHEYTQPMDFDTIMHGFRPVNFMKDEFGNIILTDPIFYNRIPKCGQYIVDKIKVSNGPTWEELEEAWSFWR